MADAVRDYIQSKTNGFALSDETGRSLQPKDERMHLRDAAALPYTGIQLLLMLLILSLLVMLMRPEIARLLEVAPTA